MMIMLFIRYIFIAIYNICAISNVFSKHTNMSKNNEKRWPQRNFLWEPSDEAVSFPSCQFLQSLSGITVTAMHIDIIIIVLLFF